MQFLRVLTRFPRWMYIQNVTTRSAWAVEEDWQTLTFNPHGFEWDHEKAKSNTAKHGIGFDEAARIFNGEILARQESHDTEDRYAAIGLARGSTLVVVFTERGENIRIISARRATPSERRRFGSHFSQGP